MKTAINQAFLYEEPESSDFKAQMRVLEEEIRREDKGEEAIDEELIIAHSAQIISIFTHNQQIAGYESELSVDFISSLIEQGLAQDELENIIEHVLASASANIAKDKSSVKKQMVKLFEMLAVLDRTARHAKAPEQLQNSLRQMQDKLRDLAKGGNVENIQKFLKEGDLKTAIKQGAEVAAIKPETFRNAAADVASRIRESQQKTLQTQPLQQNLNAASIDISSRNLSAQTRAQPQVLQQSQLVLNSAINSISTQNTALVSSLQVGQVNSASMRQNIASQTENVRTQAQPIETRVAEAVRVEQVRAEPKIEAKQDSKNEPKPDEKPPTKVHVHQGDCCGPKQEQTKEVVKTMSEDIKRAVDKEITPERREEIQTYAASGAKGAEAKYLQNTSVQSQQEATATFGYK